MSQLTDFTVVAPIAEELSVGEPKTVAERNAVLKGRSIKEKCDVVVACDTVVCLDGIIYGKPDTKEKAKEMLRALSGRTHEVISGVYLRFQNEEISFYERSEVGIKELSEEDIERYVSDFSPLDKAGAYGIQDGEVVEYFVGDYDNIVGLPLNRIRKIFVEKGYAKE